MTKRAGIYRIISPSGRSYVGSARDLRTRWAVHRAELRRGEHHCRALQQACDKYGLEHLRFEVLLECSVAELRQQEQRLIDELRPEYNSARQVDRPSELNRAIAREHMRRLNQQPWTEERREKARQRLASCQAWERNKPWTEERRKAQAERMKLRHQNGRGPWTVHKEKQQNA